MPGISDSLTALSLARSRAGLDAPLPALSAAPPSKTIGSVEQLGHLVAERRKALKLSQQNFADLAGVGRRFVSELEGGKPTVELAKVLQVLQALGIDLAATVRG